MNTRSFWCDTCNDQREMDLAGIKEHLKEKHGITLLRGEKLGHLFLDGDNYCNEYEWTMSKGVKVFEVSVGAKEA